MTSELSHALGDMIPHEKRGQVVLVPRFAWNGLLLLLALLLAGAMGHAGWLAFQNWNLQQRVTTLENDKQTALLELSREVTRLQVEDEKKMALLSRLSNEIRDIKAGVDYLKGKAERTP